MLRAQKMRPGIMDTLIGIPQDMNTMVRRSPEFNYNSSQRANGGGATINVTYTGFTASAQAAFQYAVDIWAAQLTSAVPIEVEASFSALGGGVLGSAGATYVYTDFTNAPVANTYYPSALANSLAGCDLSISSSDITASFSSSASWYYGTDGATPSGQYDFVTVVLHELGHGLGFSGSASESGGAGSLGLGGSSYPKAYDRFVVNGSSAAITSFANPSAALGTQLTSDNLFSSAPTAATANGSANVKLYLPGTWDSGSSFSHWDDATFPAGNAHSLMTHAIGTAEAIHDPGDITRGLFEDMGWKLTNTAEAIMEVRTVWFSDLSALSFTDGSILASSWAWDFDNNGSTDATSQNATYTYPSAGTYTAKLTINGNPALTTTKTIVVGTSPTLPYTEDFELDDGNYYAYSIAGCYEGWERGASSSGNFNGGNATIGGSYSWNTILTGNHGFNSRYALELPPINLASPTHDYILEFDYRAVCGTDAGFNIEYSTDGGSSWTVMGSVGDANATNWYTDASLAGLDGEPGFRQSAFTVFRPTYMLNFLFGNSDVRIRFKFGAQSSANDGVQIDNIEIDGVVLDANPISLQARQEANHIALDWKLEASESSEWFDIERTTPHSTEWESIGQIGEITGTNQFQFLDKHPQRGKNAYRIGHMKSGGAYEYSSIVEINLEVQEKLRLYPNPARETLIVEADITGSATIRLHLYDLSGKVCLSHKWDSEGSMIEAISLEGLSPGLYVYELTSGGIRHFDKLLIE